MSKEPQPPKKAEPAAGEPAKAIAKAVAALRGMPYEVAAINKEITRVLNAKDKKGRVVGNAQWGVYAFHDYDREPIYVGQTNEKLRTRIRRHLTNQRTDAVAMRVLDPFEVADIEMWPLWDLEGKPRDNAEAKAVLGRAEYTVYQMLLKKSAFGAVLNEKVPMKTEPIELPESYRGRIIPEDMFEIRKHPDIRTARRASTIATLARVISERSVNAGLRKTLLTQAQRLEHLARTRLEEIGGDIPVEEPGEETGETIAPGEDVEEEE